jgi:hypothetical protein
MNLLPSTEDVTATAFTYCKFLKEDWCTHSCRMGTDRASHPNVNSLVCLHTVFNEISLATLSLSLSVCVVGCNNTAGSESPPLPGDAATNDGA